MLHAADAERAEAGGADRVSRWWAAIETRGCPPSRPWSAGPRGDSLPVRALLRLREGYGTDGGEVARLQGLVSSVSRGRRRRDGAGLPQRAHRGGRRVAGEIVGPSRTSAWTLARAVDSCISTDRAWRELPRLPGLDRCSPPGRPAAWPRVWTIWSPAPGPIRRPEP